MRMVVSSRMSICGNSPFSTQGPPGEGVRSVLPRTSSKKKRKSSVVKGVPSDHLCPSRRWKVNVVQSSETSYARAILGMIEVRSVSMVSSFCKRISNTSQPQQVGLVVGPASSPPYSPMASSGCTTTGCAGKRSSTGGSSPAATRSASIGASPHMSIELPVAAA